MSSLPVIKRMVCLVSLGFSIPAFAAHTVPIQDNVRVMLPIAATEITRLSVAHDRIQQLIGPKGAYHLEHNAQQGDVYLQPMISHAFSVFLHTEHGHHLTVLLTPLAVPADSVRLVLQELPDGR